jgi:hypothetical protein
MMHDVAHPQPWLEATTLIEAMYAGIFSAALKEDVVTVLSPSCCERSVNNGASMTLTLKFGMSENIFEKPMLAPGSQEIWRGDKHAGCDDPCIQCRYEDRNAFTRQHF